MKFLQGRAQWGLPWKRKDSARCTSPPRPKIPSQKRRISSRKPREEKNLEVVECILKVTRDGKNLVRVATPKLQTEQRNPTPNRCRRVSKKKIIPSRYDQADSDVKSMRIQRRPPLSMMASKKKIIPSRYDKADSDVESMIIQRRPPLSMIASLDESEHFAERRPMAREMCTGRYSNRRRARGVQVE
jgi:hypothetical protein